MYAASKVGQHFLTSKSRLTKMLAKMNFWNSWISAREVTQLYPQNCIPSAKNVDFTVFEAKTSKIALLLCFHFLDNRTLIKETQKCIYLPTTYAKCTITCFLLRSNLNRILPLLYFFKYERVCSVWTVIIKSKKFNLKKWILDIGR